MLVAATALAVVALRAGWRLLVGEAPSSSREIVLWRDPVHALARDVAEGRFVVPAAPLDGADGADASLDEVIGADAPVDEADGSGGFDASPGEADGPDVDQP